MSPSGGTRPGAGRPKVGREVKIAIRETDEACAAALGQTLAAYVRGALDIRIALEDGAGIATLRTMITPAPGGKDAR